MLNDIMIYDAVEEAMNKYAALNGGKKGLAKNNLREAIYKRGGDDTDLHNAMVAGLKLFVEGRPINWKN